MRKIVPLFLLILLLCGCATLPQRPTTPPAISAETPLQFSSSGSEPSPLGASDAIPSIAVTATPSPSPVPKDDVYTSREGTLKNGRKYVFYGIDKQSFSIEQYIEKMELVNSRICDVKIQEKTIEAAAEKVQVLFHMNNATPERAGITIYYDGEIEALMFIEDYYGVLLPGGKRIIVVNCKDGLTTEYSSRYC